MLHSLREVTAFFLDPSEGVARLEESLSLYRELQNDEKVALAHVTLGLALAAHPEYSPGTNVPGALEHFRQAQACMVKGRHREAVAVRGSLEYLPGLLRGPDRFVHSARLKQRHGHPLMEPAERAEVRPLPVPGGGAPGSVSNCHVVCGLVSTADARSDRG
jgi:hypothetical protein